MERGERLRVSNKHYHTWENFEGEKIGELGIIHQFFIRQLFRNTGKYWYLINV